MIQISPDTRRHFPRLFPSALLCFLLLAPGCAEDATSFRLILEFDESVQLDQFRLALSPEGVEPAPQEKLVPDPAAAAQKSGVRILVTLPEAWDGKTVAVQVTGLAQGKD